MREIKFRGKRLDGKGWAFGHLVKMWGAWHIIDWNDENTAYAVDPTTVGQYTGLKDNKGTEIYEGDIVNVLFGDTLVPLLVVFDCGGWKIREEYDETLHDLEYYASDKEVESVIGNIHDNPELMKGDDQ